MSDMTEWTKVWQAIEDRRIALGWSKETLYDRTGTSDGTYRKMRDGVGIARPAKLVGICLALGWTRDSIDRILHDLEPIESGATPPADPDAALRTQFDAALTALGAELSKLQDRADQTDARLAELAARIDNAPPRRVQQVAKPAR